MSYRIYLSPPQLLSGEAEQVAAALASGWVAPLGPEVDAFEEEFAATIGARHAVALSSGTAGLHLSLVDLSVGSGDEVAVSSFTFAASVFPVLYQGATPVFIDSESASWNMDPGLLEDALRERARSGRRQLRAIILVHLYGQCANLDAIRDLAHHYGVPLIEDAAEALGASYRGRPPGTDGRSGVFSFNGNKIITTSGGGMLVTNSSRLADHVRKLATQAREPAVHYEHTEVGYNYRMSNLLAALGRAQLSTLEDRVSRRRRIFRYYRETLGNVRGIHFMPEADWGTHTRWLSCLTIDRDEIGRGRADVQRELHLVGIEARPVWKPMHLQPVFKGAPVYSSGISDAIFANGLCLPSGGGMSEADLAEVAGIVRATVKGESMQLRASQDL